MEAPGGTSRSFQSRARTISLQAAVLPGVLVVVVVEEEEEEEEFKMTSHI
jgi:hypothetical protein